MSNADRQKRYRDKQRDAQEIMAKAAGVTVPLSDCGTERNAQGSDWHTEKGQEILGGLLEQVGPAETLADVPYLDLSIRLHYMRDWKRTPEYKEVMRRLNTFTAAELEQQGQFIPCWKQQEAA